MYLQTADWVVLVVSVVIAAGVGLAFARRAARAGAEGYFTGNRALPWWAIGLSNTATYQSGNGAFVMLVVVFGLAGNWLWWASWIVWMPLVAIIWARLWRRMQIVTTAELLTLRYGGPPAQWARKVYAVVCCFGFSVLLISYITGFFAKTIAPLLPLDETQVLLLFGGITILYTMFGGLTGVVYVDVVQFMILMVANTIFLVLAIPQHGGWEQILQRVQEVRPLALQPTPPVPEVSWPLIAILVFQGLFFAGSPTAGEGMTAQRFMGAKNERHALGGQLFNAFLALTFRMLPLIGLGIIALSLFWTKELVDKVGPAPAGMPVLEDNAYAWAELVKRCTLPAGLIGMLIAAEVAAYMSTLSSLVNWGSSFVVNDLWAPTHPDHDPRHQVWVARLITLLLGAGAAAVAILFVDEMVAWFMFINSAMVIFLLPLAWFRFFWWRFNVWGELSAIVLGLPLSIIIWFGLDFASKPMWQGLALLLGLSFVVLLTVTLLTPPESDETLERFYRRCRPPGLWGSVGQKLGHLRRNDPSTKRLLLDAALGIGACLGLVLATNSVFLGAWARVVLGVGLAVVFGGWLLWRMLAPEAREFEGASEVAAAADGDPPGKA